MRYMLQVILILFMGLLSITSSLSAASIIPEPKSVPIIIEFRDEGTNAKRTERFIWDSIRYNEEQFWPVTELPRGREADWNISRLLPTELSANDPKGIKAVRVKGEKDLWLVGSRQVRFRFTAFGIDSPDKRQGEANRQTHEAEDLGLADLLAEEEAKEDAGFLEVDRNVTQWSS